MMRQNRTSKTSRSNIFWIERRRRLAKIRQLLYKCLPQQENLEKLTGKIGDVCQENLSRLQYAQAKIRQFSCESHSGKESSGKMNEKTGNQENFNSFSSSECNQEESTKSNFCETYQRYLNDSNYFFFSEEKQEEIKTANVDVVSDSKLVEKSCSWQVDASDFNLDNQKTSKSFLFPDEQNENIEPTPTSNEMRSYWLERRNKVAKIRRVLSKNETLSESGSLLDETKEINQENLNESKNLIFPEPNTTETPSEKDLWTKRKGRIAKMVHVLSNCELVKESNNLLNEMNIKHQYYSESFPFPEQLQENIETVLTSKTGRIFRLERKKRLAKIRRILSKFQPVKESDRLVATNKGKEKKPERSLFSYEQLKKIKKTTITVERNFWLKRKKRIEKIRRFLSMYQPIRNRWLTDTAGTYQRHQKLSKYFFSKENQQEKIETSDTHTSGCQVVKDEKLSELKSFLHSDVQNVSSDSQLIKGSKCRLEETTNSIFLEEHQENIETTFTSMKTRRSFWIERKKRIAKIRRILSKYETSKQADSNQDIQNGSKSSLYIEEQREKVEGTTAISTEKNSELEEIPKLFCYLSDCGSMEGVNNWPNKTNMRNQGYEHSSRPSFFREEQQEELKTRLDASSREGHYKLGNKGIPKPFQNLPDYEFVMGDTPYLNLRNDSYLKNLYSPGPFVFREKQQDIDAISSSSRVTEGAFWTMNQNFIFHQHNVSDLVARMRTKSYQIERERRIGKMCNFFTQCQTNNSSMLDGLNEIYQLHKNYSKHSLFSLDQQQKIMSAATRAISDSQFAKISESWLDKIPDINQENQYASLSSNRPQHCMQTAKMIYVLSHSQLVYENGKWTMDASNINPEYPHDSKQFLFSENQQEKFRKRLAVIRRHFWLERKKRIAKIRRILSKYQPMTESAWLDKASEGYKGKQQLKEDGSRMDERINNILKNQHCAESFVFLRQQQAEMKTANETTDLNSENESSSESFVSSAQTSCGSLEYRLVEVSDEIQNKYNAINLKNQSSAECFMSSKEQQEDMEISDLSLSSSDYQSDEESNNILNETDINLESQLTPESSSEEEQQEIKTAKISLGLSHFQFNKETESKLNKITDFKMENPHSAEYFVSLEKQQQEMKMPEISFGSSDHQLIRQSDNMPNKTSDANLENQPSSESFVSLEEQQQGKKTALISFNLSDHQYIKESDRIENEITDVNLGNQPSATSLVFSEEHQEGTTTAKKTLSSSDFQSVEESNNMLTDTTDINSQNQSSKEYSSSSEEQEQKMKRAEISFGSSDYRLVQESENMVNETHETNLEKQPSVSIDCQLVKGSSCRIDATSGIRVENQHTSGSLQYQESIKESNMSGETDKGNQFDRIRKTTARTRRNFWIQRKRRMEKIRHFLYICQPVKNRMDETNDIYQTHKNDSKSFLFLENQQEKIKTAEVQASIDGQSGCRLDETTDNSLENHPSSEPYLTSEKQQEMIETGKIRHFVPDCREKGSSSREDETSESDLENQLIPKSLLAREEHKNMVLTSTSSKASQTFWRSWPNETNDINQETQNDSKSSLFSEYRQAEVKTSRPAEAVSPERQLANESTCWWCQARGINQSNKYIPKSNSQLKRETVGNSEKQKRAAREAIAAGHSGRERKKRRVKRRVIKKKDLDKSKIPATTRKKRVPKRRKNTTLKSSSSRNIQIDGEIREDLCKRTKQIGTKLGQCRCSPLDCGEPHGYNRTETSSAEEWDWRLKEANYEEKYDHRSVGAGFLHYEVVPSGRIMVDKNAALAKIFPDTRDPTWSSTPFLSLAEASLSAKAAAVDIYSKNYEVVISNFRHAAR
ncbi:hypothetical protein HHI36_023124 [Cryptolaemus montrouzieri]|uniref:Uncharacterized protein n=1 Tax=Cryptolaemus montrouzieri TaxID=559131 RepID=A0ABD2PFG3_9CUCU